MATPNKTPSKTDADTKTNAKRPSPTRPGKAKQPEKVETIEDQGIGPTDPYPTGSPPAPKEE